MKGTINDVDLMGRVGHDVEVQIKEGKPAWLKLRVATNRLERGAEATDWHDVRIFGDQAVRIGQLARKGTKLHVTGSLVYDTYRTDDGRPVRTARVLARRVTLISDFGRHAQPAAEQAAA